MMMKKNWMLALSLAVGVVGGVAFAQIHTPRAAVLPPVADGCSPAGGPCQGAVDCCKDADGRDMYCDDGKCRPFAKN